MRGKSGLIALIVGMVAILAVAQLSFGAGFALYEGSARGNALAGGLVGRADDPSALFYNPAGITQLPGLQVQTGATFIVPGTTVRTEGDILNPFSTDRRSTDTEDNVWVPPHGYVSYQYSDRLWFGLAMFSPFGLGTEFPEDWPGRFNNYNAVIQSFTINPNIAIKLNDQVSVSAGVDFMYFDLTLERKIPVPIPGVGVFELDQSMEGDSFGYGFNLGLHWKPCQYAALGIAYRSQVKQNVEGTAEHSPEALSPNTDIQGDVTLPDEVFVGLAIYPMPNLSFEVGGIWTRWSTFNQLGINFDKPLLGVFPRVVVPKEWNDVWRVNVSAEYKVCDWLDLRAGYAFDESPIPDDTADYLVPANDRHLFSFGPGFHWGNWTVDLSYTYIDIAERSVDARPGLPDFVLKSKFEDGQAHLFGLSVGYRFF